MQHFSVGNPKQPQLLSTLVHCGVCGHKAFALRVWQRSKRKGPVAVIHKHFYKCSLSYRVFRHSKGADIYRCRNPFLTGSLLEGRVLATIKEVMLDPAKLRDAMDYFKADDAQAQLHAQEQTRSIESRLAALREQKRRIIDLSRETYVEKNREADAEMEVLRDRSKELLTASMRYDTAVIDEIGVEASAQGANTLPMKSHLTFLGHPGSTGDLNLEIARLGRPCHKLAAQPAHCSGNMRIRNREKETSSL